ncbi:MAG: hypothetical protein L0H94_16735, partial [Nitrospira sp.]|nr:hypothetical protein [Nitrospira sp.]
LNALAGNLGRKAGVQFIPHGSTDDPPIPWLTERTVIELVRQQETKEPAALLLYDCNPLFTMPPSVPIKRFFDQAPFFASFSSFLDESTEWADIVLPDRAVLESWGDHVAETNDPTIGLSQPVVMPLYTGTSQVGDTFLDLGRRLGIKTMHQSTFYDLLQDRWRIFLDKKPHEAAPDWFDKTWVTHLQQGGWWQEPNHIPYPLSFNPSHHYEPAILAGDEREFPFILYPYPSMTIGHGEGANRPWLQELPDTMTSVVWGSWVELNPKTAQELGIHQGDLVLVTSLVGSLEAPAVLYPGIRPDVVAIPLGQGHSSYGRYARGRGVNPLTLLSPLLDTVSGTIASGATRVRIERTGAKGRLVTLEQPAMEQSDLITIERRGRREG